MNKRFEELAKQADIYIDDIKCAVTGNRTEIIDWHIEEFGKLIVRECLNIIYEVDTHTYSYENRFLETISKIEKYFGVK